MDVFAAHVRDEVDLHEHVADHVREHVPQPSPGLTPQKGRRERGWIPFPAMVVVVVVDEREDGREPSGRRLAGMRFQRQMPSMHSSPPLQSADVEQSLVTSLVVAQ